MFEDFSSLNAADEKYRALNNISSPSLKSIAQNEKEFLADWGPVLDFDAPAPSPRLTTPAPTPNKVGQFLKRNWKIGLGSAASLFALSRIASDDDSYNYIEGMRHAGISGWSRSLNTDFGSGWQGQLYRGTKIGIGDSGHVPQGRQGYKPGSDITQAEEWLESFRKQHYPDRPSRLASTYWTPDVTNALKYAGPTGFVSQIDAPENTFFTSQSKFIDVAGSFTHQEAFFASTEYWPEEKKAEIQEGFENIIKEREAFGHQYWQGIDPKDFHKWRTPVEALIPGNVDEFTQIPRDIASKMVEQNPGNFDWRKPQETALVPYKAPSQPLQAEIVNDLPPNLGGGGARRAGTQANLEKLGRIAEVVNGLPENSLSQENLRSGATRIKVNISPQTAPQTALHTANPAREAASVTKAANPIKGATGAVSSGSGFAWKAGAAVLGLAGVFWALSGSSKKDGGNQFGSPWHGLKIFADDIVEESTQMFARTQARAKQEVSRPYIQEEEEQQQHPDGMNPYFAGSQYAELSVNDFLVEDADTIRLNLSNGQTSSIRLAGIDAPEIEHDDPSRIWPDQPFGQQAKSILEETLARQNNLRILMDPNAATTYGRNVGVLVGDNNQNINLELVRQGAASALPFGKRSEQLVSSTEFRRAEADAAAANQGMWSEEAWQINRQLQSNTKRKITHTSYTDMGRLFSDFRTSSILMRMRNTDSSLADMEAAGGKDDFNVIEGMRHGWIGANREANITDFGSGYRIAKNVIPKAPRNYAKKRTLLQGNYAANTHVRQSMKRENIIGHHRG